tara:strand:+ start:2394 stop:2831 length:438 start_codon:yes stop_codon:yes gene_type:complete
MPQPLNFRTWTDEPTFTSNFKMTSKYTDLGSPDAAKSIIGVVCNLSVGTESTTTSHSNFILQVLYRTSLKDKFEFLTSFSNSYIDSKANKGHIEEVRILDLPLSNIMHIQLQLKATVMRNDFGINDIGLIFRTYRDSTIVSFDDN